MSTPDPKKDSRESIEQIPYVLPLPNPEELLSRDHSLKGGILFGLDGYIVEIQARAMSILKRPAPWRSGPSPTRPAVKISGMARGAIQESLDRIAGSFSKLGITDTEVEILVNLVPADLPKEGTWLDLPLAMIILQAAGKLPDWSEEREGVYVLVGELGIHGEIRRVPGILSVAMQAKPGQRLIVPAGNEKECALILAKPGHEGCRIFPVSHLKEVIEFFEGTGKLQDVFKQGGIQFENAINKAPDFSLIRGQEMAKEAAYISAAGGHNLLLIGPPGEGKSLLASALPGILPRLADPEKVELTKIYSASGELKADGMAVTRRPMRSIHNTISKQALIGGGSNIPRPGEITMAHLGVLFLDEIAEFSTSTLDALRQPIENGEITVSRVGASFTYPCRFTLVAAMNPCPCGYFGTEKCKCKENDIRKYQKKISGPILDRIDLQVEMQRLSTEERFAEAGGHVSAQIRAKIEDARGRQATRFVGTGIPFNAAIPGGEVRSYCNFSEAGFEKFKEVISANILSTRSVDRLAKVSRTIADLVASDHVEAPHVIKATRFVIGGMLRDTF